MGGYCEGQERIIYLVSSVATVAASSVRWVFTDGHALATITKWFDDLAELQQVDWGAVAARYWADTVDDNDRQRRKQAEFLIYGFCPWNLITQIGVLSDNVRDQVEDILAGHPNHLHRPVEVRTEWYY